MAPFVKRVITSAIILIDILIIAERAMDSIWPSLPSRVYVATALIEVGLRMKQVRLPTNYCLLLSREINNTYFSIKDVPVYASIIGQSLQHSNVHTCIHLKKIAISKYQFRQKTFADGMEASRIRCQLSTGLTCGLMKIRSSIYFYR